MYHKLFNETEKLLRKEVLLDCDIPNFEEHQLVDNLSEKKLTIHLYLILEILSSSIEITI